MAPRWNGSQWVKTKWKDIKAGDLVLISENETFPADLLLFSTSNHTGDCKIQTANLDGETTLKTKQALPCTLGLFDKTQVISQPEVSSSVNLPDPKLHRFSGFLELNQGRFFVEDINLVWRACKLKTTEFIIGGVVYPGKHSKIMLNQRPTPFKTSRYDRVFNKIVLLNLVLHTILCVMAGALYTNFIEQNDDIEYIARTDEESAAVRGLLAYCTYFILLNNLIPIALIVTIEMVKFFQNIFVEFDVRIYDPEQDVPGRVQALSILEDLGLVDYVFSDKTGTLTANIMTFKGALIGQSLYHIEPNAKTIDDHTIHFQAEANATNKNHRRSFSMDYYEYALQQVEHDLNSTSACTPIPELAINTQSQLITEFFECIVLCNEVMTDAAHGSFNYLGSSPDEIALVDASRRTGFTFVERSATSIQVDTRQSRKEYEIKAINPFSPERKRMSVIVKHPDHNEYRLYIKGADTVIESLLDANQPFLQPTKAALTEFARQGLRTLSIGSKALTEEQFQDWFERYNECKCKVGDTTTELEELSEEIERNVVLLGCTAVEDQLQEGVPETLRDLSQAGIKVWMITGDKLETAQSIGLSCNLYEADWKVMILDQEHVLDSIRGFINLLAEDVSAALIIEGDQLLLALEHPEEFFQLCIKCRTVIVCRASPMVKSRVVKFMKKQSPKAILLAIGDGGNDISMIQSAHIGIGLYGKEGFQAANSSDLAIGKFRFLRDLMFVHGRWTTLRTGNFINLFMYKVILNNLPQFYFGIYSGFSGQSLYDEGYLVVYNVLVTAFCILIFAIFEQDVNPRVNPAIQEFMPVLYKEVKKNPPFTIVKSLAWLAFCLYSSVFLFWVPMIVYYTQIINEDGKTEGLVDLSLAVYTSGVVIFYFLLNISMNYWSWFQYLSFYVLGVMTYYPFWVYLYYGVSPEPVAVATPDILATWDFWLASFTPCLFIVLPYYIYYLVMWLFYPTAAQRVMASLKYPEKTEGETDRLN